MPKGEFDDLVFFAWFTFFFDEEEVDAGATVKNTYIILYF